jgi:hypothetical protein
MACTCACCCGACCYEGGECTVELEEVCAELGGDFQGKGTTCDPNPCDTCEGQCEWQVFATPGDDGETTEYVWSIVVECSDTLNCDCEIPEETPTPETEGVTQYVDCTTVSPP